MKRLTVCLILTFFFVPLSAQATATGLAGLSLEDLMEIEVTSVLKQPQKISEAPAAIFVITHEDIRRSGATSLPEALRLAPNLHVARINANQYAVSARGFNTTTANKLLVLIDGRGVYTPLYSGVFWEEQDVMLEDIDRIEVISGPGGTLWGSNAVNGVINVITRDSRATKGGLASLGGGPDEQGAAIRYGGGIGETATYRVYAKGFDRDETFRESGASAQDSWNLAQGGFRTDWTAASDTFTFQGDGYDGSGGSQTEAVSGGNLLARWSRKFGNDAEVRVQVYYDRRRHFIPGIFGEVRDTYDVDAQHSFVFKERNAVVWGGGYRVSQDNVTNSAFLSFLPARATTRLSNIFFQDTLELSERIHLTLGTKLEENSYTRFEMQPNALFTWKPRDRALWWSAISRAVRTPSRIDRDFYITSPAGSLDGGPDFRSEKLTAYELGYRGLPSAGWWYSLSTFYNVYDDLRSLEPVAGSPGTFVIGNKMEGETWGAELWGSHKFSDSWHVDAGYSYLRKRLRFDPDSGDTNVQQPGNDPEHQFSLRSCMDPASGVEFDVAARAIDRLSNSRVPGYVALDARLGWHVAQGVELSLLGTNLTDSRHPEFGQAPGRSEIARSIFARVLWNF